MKIYSEKITPADIRAALPSETSLVDFREFAPRSRAGRAFEFFLEGYGERHTRASAHAPIGSYSWGEMQYAPRAATWDDYGEMFAQLFKIDPAAKIAFYDGVGEFIDQTTRYVPRGMKAPWLEDAELLELRKPQVAWDASVENHGSITLVRPLTGAAKTWLEENVQEDAQYLGSALAVEPRYVDDLVAGMTGDGLTVA
jgi:hypothetical protein